MIRFIFKFLTRSVLIAVGASVVICLFYQLSSAKFWNGEWHLIEPGNPIWTKIECNHHFDGFDFIFIDPQKEKVRLQIEIKDARGNQIFKDILNFAEIFSSPTRFKNRKDVLFILEGMSQDSFYLSETTNLKSEKEVGKITRIPNSNASAFSIFSLRGFLRFYGTYYVCVTPVEENTFLAAYWASSHSSIEGILGTLQNVRPDR